MEEQPFSMSGLTGDCDQIPKGAQAYIAELESQIRNLNSELDALRPLSELAFIDSMTGLSNRRSFDIRIQAEQRRLDLDASACLSVLVLDLDNLKTINDCFGHAAGDQALKGIAEAMGRVLRPEDVCCRIGGDELVVLARGCDLSARARLAQRLRTVTGRVPGPWPEGLLRVSIGGATSAVDSQDVDALVALADERMYEDKWKNKRGGSWQQLFRARAGTEVNWARFFISGWAWAAHTMGQQREIWMNRATTFYRTQ